MPHEFFPNTKVTTVVAGTLINGNFGGTTSLVDLGLHEYHAVGFYGTFANNGTINAYACEAGGSNPRIIASLPVGSGNGQAAGIDIKSDVIAGTFGGLAGSNYAYLAAAGTVESGGTWRGALVIHSTWPRSAGTTAAANGLLAYGTALA